MAGNLQTLAFLEMSGGDMLILMFIGLLVFGRRLPDVARNLGKSLNEFKKGMSDFQNSADEAVTHVSKATNDAISEADVQATQTTYEGSPGSYDSQTAGEPAPEAYGNPVAGEPASSAASDGSPTEQSPWPSTAPDSHATDSQPGQPQPADAQQTTPKHTDAAGTCEPMS
jgi:TatA/E family protein of Tat protein translocase